MKQKIKGRLFRKCAVETGTSSSGYDWAKQTIVIAIDDSTNVAVSLFGTQCYDVEEFSEGEQVEVLVDVNATEYRGKWYNNVSFESICHEGEELVKEPPKEFDFDEWLES